MIPSISNRELTLLRKLGRKKYRQKERLFVVEGVRAVEQVIDNGRLEIVLLVFDGDQGLWKSGDWEKFSSDYRSVYVDGEDFETVSDTENSQGILALCEIPHETALADLGRSEGILIAIDRIRDPGNLGTMIRTAAWFGVNGILAGGGTVDLFHPKVARSTAGAAGSLPYRYSNLSEDLDRLEETGWEVAILASGPRAVPLSSKKPAARQVVLIGNEANGVTGQLYRDGRPVVEIGSGDKSGAQVESLNASVALSIAIYALTNYLSD